MNGEQQQYAAGCVARTLMEWFDADAAKERANNIVQALDDVNRPADVVMQALFGRLGHAYIAAVAAVLRTLAPLLPPAYGTHVIESSLVSITIAVTESCVDWGVHVTLRPWEDVGVYALGSGFVAATIVDGRGEEIAECEAISPRVEAAARKAAEVELARLVERERGE